VYDLAHLARHCVPLEDDETSAFLGWEPADRPARLRLLADRYGLDRHGRRELLELIPVSMQRARDFIEGRAQRGELAFVLVYEVMGGAERFDRRVRWWDAHRDTFADVLR